MKSKIPTLAATVLAVALNSCAATPNAESPSASDQQETAANVYEHFRTGRSQMNGYRPLGDLVDMFGDDASGYKIMTVREFNPLSPNGLALMIGSPSERRPELIFLDYEPLGSLDKLECSPGDNAYCKAIETLLQGRDDNANIEFVALCKQAFSSLVELSGEFVAGQTDTESERKVKNSYDRILSFLDRYIE